MFTQHNFTIYKVCADEKTGREEISGVFITPNASIATDGVSLLAITATEKGNFEPKIIRQDTAKELASKLKKTKSSAQVVKSDKDGIIFQTTDEKVLATPIKGVYPRYQEVLQESGKHIQVLVNPKLLKKIVEFFADFTGIVKIRIPVEPEKPLRFEADAGGQNAKGLLMQIRSSE